jgi:hypothetical protein
MAKTEGATKTSKINVLILIPLDTFGLVFEPTVSEVWEGAGKVEMFKIVKQGQTEEVVNVMLSCLQLGERIKFM